MHSIKRIWLFWNAQACLCSCHASASKLYAGKRTARAISTNERFSVTPKIEVSDHEHAFDKYGMCVFL